VDIIFTDALHKEYKHTHLILSLEKDKILFKSNKCNRVCLPKFSVYKFLIVVEEEGKYNFLHFYSWRITESQNVRGWKGPLWVIKSNSPAQAGSPTAGCTGPCPGGSSISPEKETPQPPWAMCSRAPSPSK